MVRRLRRQRDKKKRADRQRKPELEALEPRVLLSTFTVTPDGDAIDQAMRNTEGDAGVIEFNLGAAADPTEAQSEIAAESRTELVFVDTGVEGYEKLVDDLRTARTDGRTLEVFLLDAQRDGVDQISDILDDYQGLDAVHIVSHGTEGAVQLGDAWLSGDTLSSYQGHLSSWAEALSDDADLLFYGCDLAGGESGEGFVASIAKLTGADVAASSDLTGAGSLGGDWDLEIQTGAVEAELAFSSELEASFESVLDINTGLVGHWALDADASDSSGNGYSGTLISSAVIDTSDATDIVGAGKLSLSGSVDHVDLSAHTAQFASLSEGTIAAWINLSSGGERTIFSSSDSGDLRSNMTLAVDNGRLFFRVEEAGSKILDVDASTLVNDGSWHHVAVTIDPTGHKLFIDGTEITGGDLSYLAGGPGDSAFFQDVPDLDSLKIGALSSSSGLGFEFPGLIDDVRVYDRALTSGDIGELTALAPVTYPSSSGADNAYEWITNVEFAGINHTTGQDSGGYGDHTSQVGTVTAGSSYDLTVNINADSQDYVSAWIDWNRDGDFTDSGEAYVLATNTSSNGPHTVSIGVPAGAAIGETVLRVSVKYQGAPSSDESIPFGEVEDYKINVLAMSNDAATDLATGVSINADGGNDAYFGATDANFLLGAAGHTYEVTFSGLRTPTGQSTFYSHRDPGVAQSYLAVHADGTLDWAGLTTTGTYSQFFDGGIHSLAVTWTAATGDIDFYVDGAFAESLSVAPQAGSNGGTSFVLGQHLDFATGDADPDSAFQGTFHDFRVWDHARSATEVGEQYDYDFDSTNLPTGLMANWRMTGLAGAGSDTLVDLVNPGGNDLTLQHESGVGFVAGTASDSLSVAENSANGTQIGVVRPTDPDLAESHTFSLTDDASGRFAIHATTGVITVADGDALDHEASASHNITVRVTDSASNTYDEILAIAVADVNEGVSAVGDSLNTSQDTPLVFDPRANDVDPESDAVTVIEFSQPANGTVVDNGDGTLTYTPDGGFSGVDSFDYKAVDSGSGLAHYWGLDGDLSDSAGTANGTLNGTTTAPGNLGNGLAFDETTDHGLIPDISYGSEFTVSFDFKLDEINGSLFQYLYSHGDINATNSLNVFINEASHGTDPNVLRTVVRDGNDTLDNTALQVNIASLVDSSWHTYTLVVNENGAEVFIDGVSRATDATRGTDGLDPTGGVYIGARQDLDADRRFGGSLDSLQVYNTALSSPEVADLASETNRATATITVAAANVAPTDIVFDSESSAEDVANSYGASDQIDPSIAAFEDGGWMVVWASNGQDGSGYGIYGQRYHADGSLNGAELRIPLEVADSETNPSVSTFSDGGFVVSWQDQTSGVMAWTEARVFSADGTPATGDFQISPGVDGDNEGYQPAVQVLNSNEFVVVWANEVGGATYEIAGQIYDRAGSQVGGQFTVGSLVSASGLFGAQTEVSQLEDGGFAVVWRTHDGSNLGTRIRVMNADGTARSGEIALAGDDIGSIASLSNGNFVVSFDSGGDLKAAIYDANGAVVTAAFDVNTTTSAARYESSVTRSDDGFVVVWESSEGDGSGSAILAQRFEADGTKIGGEVLVNSTTAGNQLRPEAIETTSGKVVVAWEGENLDAGLTGVGFRVLGTGTASVDENAADGTRVADVLGVADVNPDDTHTFSLTDDAGGRFQIDVTTGVISVADGSLLDHETDSSHSVTVRAEDSGGLTHDEVLVISVNDRVTEPSISTPPAQSTSEDTNLVFSSGAGNAVTVTDMDPGSDLPLQVFLSVTNGTLTLSQTIGLSIPGGSNGSSFMTIQGTESDINAALEGLTYSPTASYTGPANLQITTSLGADLVGHYSFDAGTAIDDSVGISQNGVLTNGASTVTDPTRGEVLSLDGASREYVEIGSMFNEPSDVTLASWVNFSSTGTWGGDVISLGNDVALRVNEGNTGLSGFFWDGSTHQFITADVALDDGAWHHVAFTFDDAADTQHLYIDGVEVATASHTASIGYTGWWPETRIGTHVNDADVEFNYTGLIDDARIYDRALSSDEIAALAVGDTSSTANVGITVDPATGAVITAPAAAVTTEDTAFVYSGANTIQVDDRIAGDSYLRVSLDVAHGDLTLSSLTGITLVAGSNGSSTMVIEGLESDLNAALDGLRFQPDANYAGADTLTISTSITANLSAHYTFEDGTAADQSLGTLQNGTLNGDAAIVNDAERGQVLSLDGNGDFVQITGLIGEPADVTLSAWISADSVDASGAVVISMGTSPALYLHTDGTLIGYYESGGTNNVVQSTESLVGTGWRHVAVSIDATNSMTIYIDGVAVETSTPVGAIEYDNSPDTFIGRAGDGGTGFDFDGRIDDARIYERALSTGEVAALAQEQAEVTETVSITVDPVNDAPSLTRLDSDFQLALNDGVPVTLDAANPLSLSDIDSPNFDGGSLELTGTGFDALDQLGLATSGGVTLSAGISVGSVVSVFGVSVGTLTSVANDGLTISLNADSMTTRISTLAQSVTFESTSASFGSRTVALSLIDGDGTASGGADTASASMTVNVASNANGSTSATEDTTYTYVASDFDFTGVTGTNLRSITITSLPATGTLELGGVPATVGQTVTKAAIDAGQLTYDPGPGLTGSDAFDFHVNAGQQSATILAGSPNGYTMGGGLLTSTDVILLDESNFGAAGTHPTHLQFGAQSATIDASYLANGDILFNGYSADSAIDAAELAAIDTWVAAGGVLISTNDSASYDPISSHFGLVIGGTANSTWHIADTATSIINGTFGSVGNVGDPILAAGTISYFDSASLAVGDVVIANDSVSGEPTIVLREHGQGWILFTSDEGIFRTGMTGDGSVTTANDILAANLFAWAAEAAPPATLTMDIAISPVNDAPDLDLDANDSAAIGVDFATSWTVSGGPVSVVDGDAAITDVDSPTLTSLTVTISNPSDRSAETLAADTTGTSIGTSYDSATGVLTLSGVDTVANYQQVLRTITYDNSHATPYGEARVLDFVASDGTDTSTVASTTLTMNVTQGVLIVTNLSDTVNGNTASIEDLIASQGGDGISLREAILATNATANGSGPDVIRFDVAGSGPHTISLTSALPAITQSIVIDGSSEPDFAGTPMVVLDGSGIGGSPNGLVLNPGSDGSTVRGLAINGFGQGLTISGSSGNTVAGNYIGLGADGVTDQGNQNLGIRVISGSANNTIGGLSASDRNVIAGTSGDGILLDGIGTTANHVIGNYIGTSASGTAAVGNSTGIRISGSASSNFIGGTGLGAENVISGNTGTGIYVAAGADNQTIQGNLIGTDVTGMVALGNTSRGLQILSDTNTIGGTTTGAGNLISGNGGAGVDLRGASNQVQGNLIGLNLSGTASLGNGGAGVSLNSGASDNSIGGTAAGARNVISANTDGVYIQNATGTTIQGNYIGTDATGLLDLGNSDRGIQLESGADDTIIGGTSAAARNVISGNGNDGIIISDGSSPGTGTTGTIIQGNYIGVGSDGTTRLDNDANGVRITTESGHLIGGSVAGAGNLIAYSGEDGIVLSSASATDNSILGNVIHSNGQRAIDLGNNGTTANDVPANLDADSGANDLQNFPVLYTATLVGSDLRITGDLDSEASNSYRIEFYNNPLGQEDASGYGEAREFLGAIVVTTDGSGNAAIDATLTGISLSANDRVTSTATKIENAGLIGTDDAAAFGSTSEFSQNLPATIGDPVPVLDLDADDSAASGLDFAADWTEDAGPISIVDADLTLGDDDDTHLASATITIDNLLDGTDEVLAANTAGTSIVASYNSGTGVLTLSGSATIADYHQVLRTVTYDSASQDPDTTDRVVSFVVSDGTNASGVAKSTLTVNPLNDAPTAFNDAAGVTEGQSVIIDLATNDTDPDNALDLASIVITGAPANGSLVVHGDGTVTYTHDGSETIGDTFTYTIDDVSGETSNAGTVTITVTPANDVPAITIGSGPASYFEEGAAVAIAPSLTLTDADGHDGTNPSDQYSAVVRVTGNYQVGDVLGFTDTATIEGVQTGNQLILTVKSGQTASVADFQAALRTVTFSSSLDDPSLADRDLDFTFDDGVDSHTPVATQVLLTGVNDAPVRTAGTVANLTVGEDSGLTSLGLAGLAYSPGGGADEAGQSLTYEVFVIPAPSFGTVYLADGTTPVGTGTYTLGDLQGMQFAPADDESGGPSFFSFRVVDSGGTANGGSDTTTENIRLDITPVDDAPVIDLDADDSVEVGEDFSATFTEGGGPVAVVDTDAVLTDVDTANLTSLTVTITNLLDGTDELLAADTSGTSISASYDSGTGVLTLSGSDSVANYQNVLRTVKYDNASVNPDTSVRYLDFEANDGTSPSNIAVTTLTVVADNSAPSVTTTVADLAYDENDGAIAVDTGLTLSDIDSANLTGAVVQFSGAFQAAEDSLAFADQLGITGSYNAGTGVLTLSGTASVADYQTALRSVTYTNSSEVPDTTLRKIEFQVSDGAAIGSASRNVDVTSLNDDPQNLGSMPGDVAVTEDLLSAVDLSDIDLSDVDAGNQLVTLVLTTDTGGLLFSSNDFDVTVGGSGSGTLTLTGSVADLNSYLDAPAHIQYLHSTTHLEGDDVDTIQVRVTDNGNTGDGGGTLIDLGTANVDIAAVNDAPVVTAPAGPLLATEGLPLDLHNSGFVLDDVDSDTATISATLSVGEGTLTIVEGDSGATVLSGNGTNFVTLSGTASDIDNLLGASSGTIVYQNDLDAPSATTTLTLAVNDLGNVGSGGNKLDSESVTIQITPVNDAPTATPDSATVDEGDFVIIDLAGDDTDPDNALDLGSIVITSGPANGSIVVNGDGTVTYTHDGSETVGDSFSYTIDDASGAPSNVAGVTVTVDPVNDAPVAGGDTANVDEGDSVVINLVGDDSDADDGLDLSSIVITSAPSNGSIVVNGDGTVTYTHDGSETVGDSFSYTIDDNSGAASNVAGVTITVDPTNDAPVAGDDTANVDEGDSVVINLVGDDSDADDGLDLTSIVITSAPANGSIVVNGDGTVTYTHDGSETVGDSFSYTIDDNTGATSNVAGVTVTVDPTNDAPVAGDDTTNVDEGDSVVINVVGDDTDADDGLDLTSIVITSGPSNGSVVVNGDGTITYTHDGSETVGDSFSYTIDDASGATSNVAGVTLTVNPINDAPTAGDDAAAVNEGDSVVINLVGDDADADDGLDLTSIVITGAPANGSVVVNGDGTVTYTHNGGETTGDSFSYTIDDASGATSNVAGVSVTVNPVNDAPVAVGDAANVDEGGSVVIDLAGDDSDADDGLDLTSIVITSGPANGSVVVNADGTVTYTHDGSETVGDSFSYTIDDLNGTPSNVAGVTITVDPTNDAPVAGDDAANVDEGDSVVINLVGDDSDADDGLDLTSIVITSGPANGSVVVNGDGTVTYTHDGSETVGDSFSYTIDDASGATSNVAGVTITVDPTNDAPVAGGDAANVDEGDSVVIDLAGDDADSDDGLDMTSIVITSGPANGSIVVNGDGTVTYTHDGSETVGDSFSYTIDDLSGATSNVAGVTVTVDPTNDAPVAGDDTANVDEGDAVVINLVGDDSDADDGLDLSSIVITSGPANGSVVVNADGTVTYTHDGSETVGDAFSYTIDDASGATSNVAGVTVTVDPTNDAPVAGDDAASVDEGNSVVINLVGDDTDADDGLDLTSIVITSGPTNGSVVVNGDGTVTYTHDGTETLGDSFSYTINDVSGATSNIAGVSMTVNPLNDAPVAGDDTATVDEGSSVLINLISSDSDADDGLDPASIVITSAPVNGSLVVNGDGTVTYTHDGSETGGDSFSYTIDDLSGATSNIAGVTITVDPTNDAPVILDQIMSIDENSAPGTLLGTVVATDSDPGDSLAYGIAAGNLGGAFGIDPNSGDVFVVNQAAIDFETNPLMNLTIEVEDLAGTVRGATLTVNISNLNETPVLALPATQSISEGASLTFDTANGNVISLTDPDGSSAPLHVELSVARGTLTLGSTTSLVMVSGTGIGDSTVIFEGTQADVQNALEGLRFDPAPGETSVALTVLVGDLGPGGILQSSSVAITVGATAGPTPPTDPGPTTTPTTPDSTTTIDAEMPDTIAVPTPPAAARGPAAPTIVATPTLPPASDLEGIQLVDEEKAEEPESWMPPLVQSAIEVSEVAFELAEPGVTPERAEKTELVAADPLRPSFLHPAFLESLAALRQEVLDSASEEGVEAEWVVDAVENITMAAASGLLMVVMRASSLVALGLSTVPFWRSADPLMVLSMSSEERRDLQEDLREAQDDEDLSEVLDGRNKVKKEL